MSGKPTAAALKVRKLLTAGGITTAEAARKAGMSRSQAQRIAASMGIPAQPVGAPRKRAQISKPG